MDGNVYAIAQGSLIVGGLGAEGADGSRVVINTPTVGRVANGATVERAVQNPFTQGDYITFNLNNPDFTTAKRLADTINDLVGPNSAKPMDAASVRVIAPRDPSQRVAYLSTLENLSLNQQTPLPRLSWTRVPAPLWLAKMWNYSLRPLRMAASQ